MNSLRHSFQFLSLFVLLFTIPIPTVQFNIPRLGTLRRTTQENEPKTSLNSDISNDLETFYYNQTLDHFNYKPESYTTFQQRYMINFKYWGGANSSAPIFIFFGAEESLDSDLPFIGFFVDIAPRFKPLLVYLEHRYYGKSIPFGSSEEVMKNASARGYFNSAQALADYAAVILHIKQNLSAESSPVIVMGGSYGGMLASWFRLKYSHVAFGALASSAPILYFDDITPEVGYYSVVTKDFKETNENCYEVIRKSWAAINEVASQPNGLSLLSKIFNSCKQFNKSSELKDYLDSMYTEAAQYNRPPDYPVRVVCDAIDGAATGTSTRDVLGQIFAGVVAYTGNMSCYDINSFNYGSESDRWNWQTCSEMVMPIGHDSNYSMFESAPFNFTSYVDSCKASYGVSPRPHWITTYYGGHDIKLILHRFASNIIFSNGLRDPYSTGGVLENISDSVVAVTTVNGSHCLDIQFATASDPEWLVAQRKTEADIIEGWLSTYRADLAAFKQHA